MMLYICTKFHENTSDSFKVIEWTPFLKLMISKGHNFAKKVGGVIVLDLRLLSDDALYLYQV